MADGSIIIDTRIDTGGVSKGMNAVKAGMTRISAQVSKMGDSAKSSFQRQITAITDLYQNYEKQERKVSELSFSQGRYKSAIRKLAEKHPDDCQIVADNEDGSICAHVPVAWIRISPPKQYTEEQRQQMGERMRRNISANTGVWE